MTISKMRPELGYISGRVTALASRPLILLVLNYWGGNDLAAAVAVIFLLAMLALAASVFDTHRVFYQAYFGDKQLRSIRSHYRLYCGATSLQVSVVSPLLAALVAFRFGDPMLAILVAAYFASERLADEAQRFLIFKGLRQEWGVRVMAKALLQLTGASASAALLGADAAHAAVGLLVVGNVAAYGAKVPWRYLPTRWLDWKTGAVECINQRLFWLLSLVTSLISYLDRFMVLLFQQSDMALYTILVSSMSIVQNAVDYFFVSVRRKDFLKGEVGLAGVFRNRSLYLALCISVLAGCLLSWGLIRVYNGHQLEHPKLVPIVLLSQLAMSVTLVLREIIYWNHSVQRLVWMELGFIVCALVAATTLRAMGAGYEEVLGMIALFLTLRMTLMIRDVALAQKRNLEKTQLV